MFFQPSRKIELKKCLLMSRTFITLRTSCGAVYCNQSCLCILSLNISHLAATFFYKRHKKKNSSIGKKCRNNVQKFTPTKISRGI